jgi:nucleoside-diphosphate-sugar epimerase
MEMKTVVISGAGGFLVKKLVAELSRINVKVVALYRSAIPESLRFLPNVDWVMTDLADYNDKLVIAGKIDVVVHLAGSTLGALKNETEFFRDNEIATFNLLNQLSEQCSNFIYASSQVVYGDVCDFDVKEDAALDVTESPYACSKVNCENWLRWFQKKTGGTYLSLRFCGFIDGGGLIDYIVAMATQGKDIGLFSNGEIVRDYLSSDDATVALSKAINCIAGLGNDFIPINIGSGQTISALDIAEIVCMTVNSDSTITRLDKNGPQGDLILNNSKARDLLDFEPRSLVEEIIKYSQSKRVSSER